MQAYTAVDVSTRRAAGELGEVVVHIGNNGVYTEEEFDQTMQALEGVRRVVFVNVNVPRLGGAQQRGDLGGRGTLPERRAR